ncbi:MAG: hypothetical protein ACI8Q2_000487 [Candidatus Omnitrophota bacterium]|jgi:hypothetical protein
MKKTDVGLFGVFLIILIVCNVKISSFKTAFETLFNRQSFFLKVNIFFLCEGVPIYNSNII